MRNLLLFVFVLVLSGCSKSETPLVVLATNENGRPEFDYAGPGMYSYNSHFDSFSFNIGPISGKPWTTGNGEMKLGNSNDIAITIQSESDRAFDIRFLGLLKSNDTNAPEDHTVETLHIPPGKQTLKLDRFVIFTYDFRKR